jgi:hypothetical protein
LALYGAERKAVEGHPGNEVGRPEDHLTGGGDVHSSEAAADIGEGREDLLFGGTVAGGQGEDERLAARAARQSIVIETHLATPLR